MGELTKALVQVGRINLSFEGSEAFVSAQVDRFATAILHQVSGAAMEDPQPDGEDNTGSNGGQGEQKKKRNRSSSGAGQGCSAKVAALLGEGFFNKGKSTTQVANELKQRATPYAKNKISAALINLARARKLRRYEEAGDWLYIVP